MAGPGFTHNIAQHVVTQRVKTPLSPNPPPEDAKPDAEQPQTESWGGFFKNLFGLDGPKQTWRESLKDLWDYILAVFGFRM